MEKLKELLINIDKIEDDQEFVEKENEVIRQYCIDNNFNITEDDMNEIIQRGMEDAYAYWKEEFS